jgi:hypothetical protein
LWENNRQLIKDPNKIYAGFYLYYQPEGRMAHETTDQTAPSASVKPTAPQVNPGVVAAMNSANPVTKNVAQNTMPAAPTAPAAPANTARAPASVK